MGRKPTSSATPMTTAMLSIVWIRLPRTWPVSTEARAMAMVRNRAMMPSVMSMATEIAVPWAAARHGDQEDPGRDVVDVLGAAAGAAAEPPRPAPSVPPNT